VTRLTSGDIETLSDQLIDFDERLRRQTGRDMLGIACHGANISPKNIRDKMDTLTIAVVTITAGLGKITGFAQTIKDILSHLGFTAFIPPQTDAAGLALAIEDKADIVFMADDNRYFAINLKNVLLVDNIQATGNVFAAALDLMAKGIKDKSVLVIGAGPVGMASARTLAEFGACVSVHDKDRVKCQKNCDAMNKSLTKKIEPVHNFEPNDFEPNDFEPNDFESDDFESVSNKYNFFIEATNAKDVINSAMVNPETFIAAPGVPLGVTQNALKKAGDRILYDPLQLGTAAMAVRAAFPLKRD
jgi:3-methylornithyl-N6-L-lysine dehydrogenase